MSERERTVTVWGTPNKVSVTESQRACGSLPVITWEKPSLFKIVAQARHLSAGARRPHTTETDRAAASGRPVQRPTKGLARNNATHALDSPQMTQRSPWIR